MAEFPRTFVNELQPAPFYDLNARGRIAVAELGHRGIEVMVGLRQQDLPEISAIAQQEQVHEYCPADLTSRFSTTKLATKWLQKNTGRSMIQGRDIDSGTLAAYGWLGQNTIEELPDCETTFAIRLNPRSYTGKGLGTRFVEAILATGQAMYGAQKVGLETWESNTSAVRTYEKLGAVVVAQSRGERFSHYSATGLLTDVRLFMKFPHTFPE